MACATPGFRRCSAPRCSRSCRPLPNGPIPLRWTWAQRWRHCAPSTADPPIPTSRAAGAERSPRAQQMDGVANTRSESCAPMTTVTWSTAVSCADPTSLRAAASTPACGRCASGYRTAEVVAPVVVTAPTCIPAVLRRETSSAAAAGLPEPLRMSTMAGAPSSDPVLHPGVGVGAEVGVEVGAGFAVDCGDEPGVVDDDGDDDGDGVLGGGCVVGDGVLDGGCVVGGCVVGGGVVGGFVVGGCVVGDGALGGGCVLGDGALDGGSPVVEDGVAGGGTDVGPSAARAAPAAGTRCTGTAGGGAGLAGGTDGGASAGGVGRLGAGVPA